MRLQAVFPKLLATIAIALVALPVHAQVIFVSPCGLEIPAGTIGILKVWVCVENSIRDGVIGAQFRIAGVPPTWVATASASSGAWMEGDIFGNGANIGLYTCNAGVGQYLELVTLALYATDAQTDVLLATTAINPPLPPPYNCAFVNKCDAPAFTKVCTGASGAWINGRKHGCPLAVTAQSWGEVKSLYNN